MKSAASYAKFPAMQLHNQKTIFLRQKMKSAADNIHGPALIPAIRLCRYVIYSGFLLACLNSTQAAEWNTITHSDMDSRTTTSIAIIENDEGHTFEVYKDSVDAVRARFTLANELLSFPANFCPTFQVDNGPPKNRSINDAPCLSDRTWAEFILGYVENREINSAAIAGMMNGVNLRLRFRLVNGDYHETVFSLRGSKRAMSAALGLTVSVAPVN